LGAAALALGFGAAIAAAAPSASADTGRAENSGRQVKASAAAATSTAVSRAPRASTSRAAAKATAAQSGLMLTPTGQGRYRLSSGSTGAGELSGISYAGGTSYYAVGDNGAASIWQVPTTLAGGFGWVNSSVISGGISAPAMGRDSEGIAVRPGTNTAWVSDEIASTITEFSLSTGAKVGAVAVPEIYRPANVQNNMGLEALAYGAGKLWTANEEALRPDGPLSSTSSGSWVRIQEFGGEDLAPMTQYAYRTNRISAMSPFITVERSGLVDLLALPDGRVLALERELGGYLPSFRSRIYELNFSAATDVSALPTLTAGGFTPVGKKLLWQSVFLTDNFEGMALGPRLKDGTYSILLISDDGGGEARQEQNLFSLVLRGVQDSPSIAV
jgi:hypothetical protein